jgi:hypothetical protein
MLPPCDPLGFLWGQEFALNVIQTAQRLKGSLRGSGPIPG